MALAVISYPALAALDRDRADLVLAVAAAVLFPCVLPRLKGLGGPAAWLAALVAVYALSSLFGDPYVSDRAQGFRHTLTTACLAVVLLTFATYGSQFLSMLWFRVAATAALSVDVVFVLTANLPKNATGGALIYLCALAITALLARRSSSGWAGALAFSAIGIGLSYFLQFRFLAACSLIHLLAFGFTTAFRSRGYWLAGLVGSVTTIGMVLWFFLNLDQGGFAWQIGQRLTEITGHRVNSGREKIWSHVLYAMKDTPVFGMGAGALPRDFMLTTLSTHSYYLQVFMQTGAVGLAVVIGVLLRLWSILSKARSAAGRFGSAVFVMFVVHNATEVIMFQNNALVATPAWCCIGLAIAVERANPCATGRSKPPTE